MSWCTVGAKGGFCKATPAPLGPNGWRCEKHKDVPLGRDLPERDPENPLHWGPGNPYSKKVNT